MTQTFIQAPPPRSTGPAAPADLTLTASVAPSRSTKVFAFGQAILAHVVVWFLAFVAPRDDQR